MKFFDAVLLRNVQKYQLFFMNLKVLCPLRILIVLNLIENVSILILEIEYQNEEGKGGYYFNFTFMDPIISVVSLF